MLRAKHVDGVVMIPSQDPLSLIQPLRQAHIPTVILEHDLSEQHCVVVDDTQGGWLGAQLLGDHTREELDALLTSAGVSPMTLNSIEFISFRDESDYARILARCRELCETAQFIDCPTVIVVPSPTPDRETAWAASSSTAGAS